VAPLRPLRPGLPPTFGHLSCGPVPGGKLLDRRPYLPGSPLAIPCSNSFPDSGSEQKPVVHIHSRCQIPANLPVQQGLLGRWISLHCLPESPEQSSEIVASAIFFRKVACPRPCVLLFQTLGATPQNLQIQAAAGRFRKSTEPRIPFDRIPARASTNARKEPGSPSLSSPNCLKPPSAWHPTRT